MVPFQEHASAVQELLDDGDWEVRSCTLEALAGGGGFGCAWTFFLRTRCRYDCGSEPTSGTFLRRENHPTGVVFL